MVARVTSKGRVTIPADIRRRAGLLPGTEVVVSYDAGVVRLTAAGPRPAQEAARRLVDRLRGSASAGLSTDEVMALTRGE